jgi:hypothetical protein
MQTGIMPCETFRTVPFQYSNSHSSENCLRRAFRALVFSKAYRNAKCFSTKWQHDNGDGGAWLKEAASVEAATGAWYSARYHAQPSQSSQYLYVATGTFAS